MGRAAPAPNLGGVRPGDATAPPAADARTADGRRPSLFQGPPRILVGFDGRPGSRDALALAAGLLDAGGGELTVVSVRPYRAEMLGAEPFGLAVAEDEQWVRRIASGVLGELPFAVRVLAGGHEAAALHELAGAEDADLIVLGSTHRGRPGRAFPGSGGEKVLDEAPCAVAVAPRGLADTGLALRQIAVGFDGSREAGTALAAAAALAERCDAALRVLAVVDPEIDVTGFRYESPEELEEARVRRQLERALASLPADLNAAGSVLHGAPATTLVDAAAEADLLMLGSRGHYSLGRRLLLGSVAARVVHGAPLPVLLTPAS